MSTTPTKTGGATDTAVTPTSDPKTVAQTLLSDAKEDVATKVASASLDALTEASDAILAERNDIDPVETRQIQFYDAALKAVDTAIREVTWALEEQAKAEAAEDAAAKAAEA